MNNYNNVKVWDVITQPYLIFNGCWRPWTSNYTPQNYMHAITHTCHNLASYIWCKHGTRFSMFYLFVWRVRRQLMFWNNINVVQCSFVQDSGNIYSITFHIGIHIWYIVYLDTDDSQVQYLLQIKLSMAHPVAQSRLVWGSHDLLALLALCWESTGDTKDQ